MKLGYFKTVGSSLIFLSLASWVAASSILAADPAVLQAKKEAEAKGYIFYTTHDEIVAMAKKEGRLKVMTGLKPSSYKPLIDEFKKRYPFITDIHVEEVAGITASQRVLLEIKAGQAKGWDLTNILRDLGAEYPPYLKKHDILGMGKHGVLKIHPGMVDPRERNIAGVTSSLRLVPYNRKLISEDKVPAKWEDFLKPEFKGRKFILDVRPVQIAGLVPAWGLERTLDFARKLAAQQPVWGLGATRMNNALLAGERSLYLGSSYNSIERAMGKDLTGSLGYKIIEPIPIINADVATGILNTADHPHAALLWLEFLASPEGQQIIDKYEPFEASVFTPGSVTEQMTRGKKLSVVDWDHFTKYGDYLAKITEAYGFPKGEIK
ncbi:MAG: extracellular solute-binding protein [Deltaproteobacteria bacterium]|nr:extracellular solute-binding protein [Deltaproteobacteria bacterium]